MSLFSSLSVSLSGLQAITTQMQVAANNIANASNEGYTKKTAVTQAVTLGNEGGGTQVFGYTRAANNALATTLNIAVSDLGLRGTQNDYLQQLQNILGATDSTNPPLSTAISDFASAWRQLAASPDDNVCQRQVIQTGSNLVSTIKNISSAVDALDLQCRNDIDNTLTDFNSWLVSIDDLNEKISLGISAGVNVGNLQDERDMLVKKVASLMNIKVMERAQGQVALYTTSGSMLIDGDPRSFSYDGANVYADSDPTRSLNYSMTGGKLEALFSFRATATNVSADPGTNVLQKVRSQLDEIVSAFTDTSLGPPATFANSYNGIATATATNGITFSSTYSGTFGNDVTVRVQDTGGGTYSATIHKEGQTDEVYTGLTTAGAGFWTNLATAINDGGGVPASPSSRLITATVTGTGTATPPTDTTYTLAGGNGDNVNGAASTGIYSNGVATTTIQSNCLTCFARTSGSAGDDISITIVQGSDAHHYDVTITDGTTTEQFLEVDDNPGGGGNDLWVNIATAINTGGGTPAQPRSTLITAVAGTGTAVPDGLTHDLTGGTSAGTTCLSLTALEAGTDGNNITATISPGTNAGTYRVTIQAPGHTAEVYNNIDNSGSGLWANIAAAINQGQVGPPAVAASTICMATAGTATTLPTSGSTTSYSFADGTNELLSGFFTGTDASTFDVNANLVDGTQTLKTVSPPAVGDAFNSSTRTFTADGLSVSGASYETLAASIITGFQQSATNISSLNSAASAQKDYLQQRLTNETAVNVDDETVNLTMLQNAYGASAHVIQVINSLFDILESTMR